MIQRCDRPGFTLEPGQAIGDARGVLWQDFDGDFPAQPGVSRPIHLAHATGAERPDDLVGAETTAGGQRHQTRLARWTAALLIGGTLSPGPPSRSLRALAQRSELDQSLSQRLDLPRNAR